MEVPPGKDRDCKVQAATSETEMFVKAAKLGWSSDEILHLKAIYGPALSLEHPQPSLSQQFPRLEAEQ